MKLIEADMLADRIRDMLPSATGIVGYKLSRNLRMLEDELIEYRKIKLDLFRRYGTEEDGSITIPKDSDNYRRYMNEMMPYDSQEADFPFRRIAEAELMDSSLNGEQMYIIEQYMEEDNEAECQ